MKIFLTILKFAIGLVILLPVSIIVLATVLGIFGALLGLAILVLRIAVLGLLGYGAYRLVKWLMRSPSKETQPEIRALPAVDRHYEAAIRELDQELGGAR